MISHESGVLRAAELGGCSSMRAGIAAADELDAAVEVGNAVVERALLTLSTILP